jgi:hypothetical protein
MHLRAQLPAETAFEHLDLTNLYTYFLLGIITVKKPWLHSISGEPAGKLKIFS